MRGHSEEANSPADCYLGRAEVQPGTHSAVPSSPSYPQPTPVVWLEGLLQGKEWSPAHPLPQLMQEVPLLVSLVPPFYPRDSHW